jgi:hypothetical protein
MVNAHEGTFTSQRHPYSQVEVDAWPDGYCTSEQMDLWKQVFDEAANRAWRAEVALARH